MHSAITSLPLADSALNAEPRVKGRLQCYALRQLAYRLAQAIGSLPMTADEDTLRARAQSVSALIRAFSEADERARIARGRPLPGSLRPERKPKPQRQPTIRVKPTRETAPASEPPRAGALDTNTPGPAGSPQPPK